MGLMSLNNDLFFVDLILDFYGNKFIGYGLYVVDRYCMVIVVYSFFFDFQLEIIVVDDWLDVRMEDGFQDILDVKESDFCDYGILKFNICLFMNWKFVSIL